MQIQVLDNFYPEALINNLNKAREYEFKFSRSDSGGHNYWTLDLYGDNYKEEKVTNNSFKKNEVKLLWDYFSSRFNVDISYLESCYINVLSHGVEAHPHIDFYDENSTTVILYLCETWNCYWSGETVFFKNKWVNNPADESFYNNEIIESVLPRKNRMVLFEGNIVHSVRPLSKTCTDLRLTLMFKLKNISIDELMENYKYNEGLGN
jgi:Rps23 Pro-64 3,4-dihydroxylase Tpa1-like proline 4-hydroxylase